MTMSKAFLTWVQSNLEDRGWSYSELARRMGDMTPAGVARVFNDNRGPTFNFCTGVARAFEEPPEKILRQAGLLPRLPPPVAEEREAIGILRRLSDQVRENALAMLRALANTSPAATAPSSSSSSTPALCSLRLYPSKNEGMCDTSHRIDWGLC